MTGNRFAMLLRDVPVALGLVALIAFIFVLSDVFGVKIP